MNKELSPSENNEEMPDSTSNEELPPENNEPGIEDWVYCYYNMIKRSIFP